MRPELETALDDEEEDVRVSYRRRLTALLAAAVLVLLSAPVALVYRKLHRLPKLVPDQDDGIRPIAAISGLARDTPRVKPAPVEVAPPKAPASVLAAAISMLAPAKTPEPPALATLDSTPTASASLSAPGRIASADKSSAARRRTMAIRPKKVRLVKKRVAPLIFARVENVYELDFPAPPLRKAVEPGQSAPVEEKPAPQRHPLEPEAVPDALERAPVPAPIPSAGTKPAKSAVIIERVPSN